MLPVRKNQNQAWLPSIFNDIFDTDWMAYSLELAAPGMTKDDFQVHVDENDNLVIRMEKKTENKDEDKKSGRYLRREFSYSKFQQVMSLPDNVDKEKISAQVENGVLTVEMPKIQEEEKPASIKHIEIK